MLDKLFGDHGRLLHAALDGTSARTLAINENLANIDTPGYKRKEVEFETQLQRYRRRKDGGEKSMAVTHHHHMGIADMAGTHPMHLEVGPSSLAGFRPAEWRSEATTFRNDKSNVDIDLEMAQLAQSQMTYTTVATFMQRKFEGLKTAIKGQ